MKTLVLLSLSLAVALGMPPFAPGVAPLMGDWVPVQGHVVVEDPAPQVRPGSKEHQEKLAPVPVGTAQNMVELEMKVKSQVAEKQEGEVKTDVKKEPEIKPEPEVKAEPEVKSEPEVKPLPEVKPEPEVKAEPEVKPKPEVKAEPEVKPEPEVKSEPKVKPEPEVKSDPGVKSEPKVKPEPEVKAEPEVKPEPEVKAEPEVKSEPEVKPEPEVKAEPEVKPEPEVEVEQKLQAEPEVKPESEVKVDLQSEPDVQDEFQVQMTLEAETETGQEIEERHIDMEGKYEMVGGPIMELEPLDDDNMELSDTEKSLRMAFTNQDPVIQSVPEEEEGFMRERDNVLDGEPIMELEPLDDDDMELSDVEKSLRTAFIGEPIMELEPLDDDNMELSDVEKSLRAAFTNQDPVNQPLPEEEGVMKERNNVLDGEPIMELEPLDDDNTQPADMEKSLKTAFIGEPIMELEPLDDGNRELSDVEKSLRTAFTNQDPVNQPLTEEEGVMRERNNVLDGEPIMELEPLDDDNTEPSDMEKSLRTAFIGEPIMELEPEEEELSLHQQDMQDAAIMDGSGPALDIMGQPILSLDEYFPNEEARMGVGPGKQQDSRTEGSDYLMMEEPGSEFVREEEVFEEPEMKDVPVLDGGLQTGVAPEREKRALMSERIKEERQLSPNLDEEGQSYCPGVVFEEKCYQFFKEPKRAADAEFYCQDHFSGGHLASIKNQHIHRELMKMMLQQNGAYTRTWIGGLRYLETGRFLWLDGSHWSYADWLSGEPNNTADVEDCVEVLPYGNGKFNDFTCWEPQAFICSYPY